MNLLSARVPPSGNLFTAGTQTDADNQAESGCCSL